MLFVSYNRWNHLSLCWYMFVHPFTLFFRRTLELVIWVTHFVGEKPDLPVPLWSFFEGQQLHHSGWTSCASPCGLCPQSQHLPASVLGLHISHSPQQCNTEKWPFKGLDLSTVICKSKVLLRKLFTQPSRAPASLGSALLCKYIFICIQGI